MEITFWVIMRKPKEANINTRDEDLFCLNFLNPNRSIMIPADIDAINATKEDMRIFSKVESLYDTCRYLFIKIPV